MGATAADVAGDLQQVLVTVVAGAIHPHARGRTTTRRIMAHAPHVLLAFMAAALLVRPLPCPPQPPRSQRVCGGCIAGLPAMSRR